MYTQRLKLFGLVMFMLQDGYCTSALSTFIPVITFRSIFGTVAYVRKDLTYEGNYNTHSMLSLGVDASESLLLSG